LCELHAKEMTINTESERFKKEAEKYAAYLESPEGRLRIDLAFANLQEFLPGSAHSFRALDIGCGTGALAVRLAQLGLHVTALDASEPMLELTRWAARQAGAAGEITLKLGDANQLEALFDAGNFDLILCHNVLEFVDDPATVLRSAARALRKDSGVISVLVRNHAGEVFKAALVNGDLAAAQRNLISEWGDESLYGGKVRLFAPQDLRSMMEAASFVVSAERGVRVVSDYLPPKISRNDEYERILALEQKLGRLPEYAAVARYTQCVALRTT
jgi:S-adenosylmethionine-dependent methyltransferase